MVLLLHPPLLSTHPLPRGKQRGSLTEPGDLRQGLVILDRLHHTLGNFQMHTQDPDFPGLLAQRALRPSQTS